MSDLISRQAVLDAIQKLNIPEDMCVFEIISHIEVAIATLPSVENKGEWIPVSERLPEYDEDIIITRKGSMGQPITNVSYFDGDFRTEDGEEYFSKVIAWQPLPEPYKKGGE